MSPSVQFYSVALKLSIDFFLMFCLLDQDSFLKPSFTFPSRGWGECSNRLSFGGVATSNSSIKRESVGVNLDRKSVV